MHGRARWIPLGETFNPRSNALNLLRIVLAVAVICSHSLLLGGFRGETLWGHGTIGDLAVDAFFAVSGFLITPSAERNHAGRYLWMRGLRIFPAFWGCLIVTAAATVIAPGWTAGGAVHYVMGNLSLSIRAYGIGTSPAGVPLPGAWDGSLWTLRWEFACYLMVAALAVTGLLRRRRVVLALFAVSWLVALALAAKGVPATDTPAHDVIRFVPVFLAGSVLWLYRDKVPDSGILFGFALTLAAAGTFLRNPVVLSGPPLAYVCAWLAVHLPGKKVGTKRDVSYGAYIYGFPAAQALACWHMYRLGYVPFTLATIAVTLPLALGSCLLIEQPALRLKRWSPFARPSGRHQSRASDQNGGIGVMVDVH
jgi:peptidoglycan/LPS O-acetylase OafA/YrhL